MLLRFFCYNILGDALWFFLLTWACHFIALTMSETCLCYWLLDSEVMNEKLNVKKAKLLCEILLTRFCSFTSSCSSTYVIVEYFLAFKSIPIFFPINYCNSLCYKIQLDLLGVFGSRFIVFFKIGRASCRERV